MVNVVIVILCCLLSAFIGYELAMSKSKKASTQHIDELKEFYHENTKILVNKLQEYCERDKGSE
jgi:hypothetical protein